MNTSCTLHEDTNLHKNPLVNCEEMKQLLVKPVGIGQFGEVFILNTLGYAVKVMRKPSLNDYQSSASNSNSNSRTGSLDNYIYNDEFDESESNIFEKTDQQFSDSDSNSDSDSDSDLDLDLKSDLESENNVDDESDSDSDSDDTFTNEEDLMREISSMKMLNNTCPNHIARYYGYYEDDNNYYVILEPVESLDFSKMLDPIYFERLVNHLVNGLRCMHDNHITHSDIKIENVMHNADKDSFVFIDFGLSCKDESCAIRGNNMYMAPEMLNFLKTQDTITFDESRRNDLWGLGKLLLMLSLWSNDKDITRDLDFAQKAMIEMSRNKLGNLNNDDSISYYINTFLPNTLGQYIDKASIKYPNLMVNDVSFKNVLEDLLQIDPSKRTLP